MYSQEDIDRIWDKIDVKGPDECWEWRGGTNKKGYGTVWLGGHTVSVHRAVYEISTGAKIPPRICVCHRCDNRRCENPAHLFLGTNQDNMDDMKTKGRRVVTRGVGHPTHKLSEEQVSEIRTAYKKGVYRQGSRVFARRYGVTKTVILRIARNQGYAEERETA